MPKLRYLLFIALLAYLATGIAQVRPEERGVVRRFGRVVARPGPGLWIGLPWGIDRFDREPVRTVRQLAVGSSPEEPFDPSGQFLTGDQNLVNVRLVIEYAVDETALEDFVVQRSEVVPAVKREAEALAAAWIGARPVDAVLADRAGLAQQLAANLSDRLKTLRIGVVVDRVAVESLAAPEEVRDAFEAVNQAQTGIRTLGHQATQQASRQLSEAASMKARLHSEAEAYRGEKLAASKAEAEGFGLRRAQYERQRAAHPDWLAVLWREEIGKLLEGVKLRGRIEVLNDFLGANGLELHQLMGGKKR